MPSFAPLSSAPVSALPLIDGPVSVPLAGLALAVHAPSGVGEVRVVEVPLANQLLSPFAPIVRGVIRTILPEPTAYVLTASAPVVSALTTYELVESFSSGSAVGFGIKPPMAEAITITESFDPVATYRLLEAVGLTDSLAVSSTIFAAMSEAIGVREALLYTLRVLVAHEVTLTDTSDAVAHRLLLAAELLSVVATATNTSTSTAAAEEAMVVSEALRYTAAALAEDSATFSSASLVETLRNARMVEALTLQADSATTMTVYGTLLEVLTVRDVAALAFGLTAQETAQFSDALSSMLSAALTVEETLTVGETLSPLFTFVGRATEALDLSDTAPVSLVAALMSTEGVAFVERLPLGDDDFQMWVMNAENLGLTQYQNCPFNSVVSHEGRSFGVSETGIYEWSGDDDAGSEIDAHFSTGMMTFGDSMRRKSIPRAYLYMESDSRVYLRTITDERTGDRRQRWYQIEARSGDVLQTRRVKLARGVKAVSWKVEVTNVDGGTLDVRGLDVLPVILRRKP